MTQLDFEAIFDAVPTPYLVLAPDLTVLAANTARERATGRPRGEVVGRHLFEVFPDNPEDPSASGVANLGASLRRVLQTGRVDVMPVQQYDIHAGDRYAPRWWSPVNAPVLDDAGRVVVLLHRVEDVTEYVLARHEAPVAVPEVEPGRSVGATSDAAPSSAESAVVEASSPTGWDHIESDVWVRGGELRAALDREERAARRLSALVQVALRLNDAATVADLAQVVTDHGLVVLEAEACAIGLLAPGGDPQQLTMTHALGPGARAPFDHVCLDGPLPASVAARTGRAVLLHDREESLAWAPQMAEVLEATGLGAWASLPLTAGDDVLGSLSIGWRTAQPFTERDVDVLSAFAAQCAQVVARIRAEQHREEVIAAERALSEALQHSLLTTPLQPDHLGIAVRYLPATEGAEIGGDWYDCFLSPDGETTLVIGDITGHDRNAAALMGQVRNLLRGVSVTVGQPPAAVLSALERAMDVLAVGALATAVLAQVTQTPQQAEQGVRALQWSNAGHPPPVLVPPDGPARLLQAPADLLLGIDAPTERHDHEVDLPPGSTVVLYTDGLVERRGVPLQQGLDWLVSALEDLRGLTAEALCDALLGRLDAGHEDDIALLVLHTA